MRNRILRLSSSFILNLGLKRILGCCFEQSQITPS